MEFIQYRAVARATKLLAISVTSAYDPSVRKHVLLILASVLSAFTLLVNPALGTTEASNREAVTDVAHGDHCHFAHQCETSNSAAAAAALPGGQAFSFPANFNLALTGGPEAQPQEHIQLVPTQPPQLG